MYQIFVYQGHILIASCIILWEDIRASLQMMSSLYPPREVSRPRSPLIVVNVVGVRQKFVVTAELPGIDTVQRFAKISFLFLSLVSHNKFP